MRAWDPIPLRGPTLEFGGPLGECGNPLETPPRPPPTILFPSKGRIRPLEILHTNKIVTNLHPRWEWWQRRLSWRPSPGPGTLRLLVQPRDQEILALALAAGAQSSYPNFVSQTLGRTRDGMRQAPRHSCSSWGSASTLILVFLSPSGHCKASLTSDGCPQRNAQTPL